MRTINPLDDSMTLYCCHCGGVIETIQRSCGVGYLVDDIVRSEVGLLLGSNRSWLEWMDDAGVMHQSRVNLYHSCGKCAAQLLDIIDMYYGLDDYL